MTKPFALITGASSGIGYELSKLFAQDGIHLVLVARQHTLLSQLADQLRDKYKVDVIVIVKDLSSIEEVKSLYQEIQQLNLNIEYLVNSAGLGDYGLFIKTDWEKELNMLNINITALTYLTKVFAQDMVKQGKGKILNLGSIASFFPGPLMAVYYSTKAYVLRLGLAVAEELRSTGVTITTLCPGLLKVSFNKLPTWSSQKSLRTRTYQLPKKSLSLAIGG